VEKRLERERKRLERIEEETLRNLRRLAEESDICEPKPNKPEAN